ncbi:MAG: helix-turn-helix domain-containing protein [Acidobacteriota bacterium]
MPAKPDARTSTARATSGSLPPFELLGPARTAELDVYVRAAQQPPTRRRPILVQGDVGTWKDRWAECFHERTGGRGAFVRLHCGINASRRTEDLLFDSLPSAQGTSAWYRARGGTLLLEEVQGLPEDAQLELAHRISEEEGPQVIATTSSTLDVAVRAGQFAARLYRLFARQLIIAPPLVRCRRDLLRIIEALLNWHASRRGVRVPRLSDGASKAALEHDWQGNLRELESRVERAMLTSSKTSLEAQHLGLIASPSMPGEERPLADLLKDYEKQVLQDCLAETAGDLDEACRKLGLNRRGLLYRLKKHDLDVSSFRS